MAQHKLNKDKQKHIRERITDMMREAEPTPFAMEGPCRAGIRASLCLQSWPWQLADQVAGQIVTAALNMAGAKRPNWYEGQPEWTQPGVHRIQFDRCRRCHVPLPDGHFQFCSKVCGAAWHVDRTRQARSDELNAMARAKRAAWSDKQPEQECEHCKVHFRPRFPNQRFCRQTCAGSFYGGNR